MGDFDRPTRIGRPMMQIGLLGSGGLALEACCGNRREWSREKPIRTIFGDSSMRAHPQLVMDFRALPFLDGVFDEIFFDPPHLIRKEKWTHLNNRYEHFGKWETRAEWEAALDAINTEFYRVTTEGSRLHVKIIDGRDRRVTKLGDLDRLTLWRQVDLKLRPSRVKWSTCQTVTATYEREAIA